ncbi:hypothetical protein NE471_28115, partial [Escherichia coli]
MDFDTIMEKAYEEYFDGLAEGEEALSFSEFKQALSSSGKSNIHLYAMTGRSTGAGGASAGYVRSRRYL